MCIRDSNLARTPLHELTEHNTDFTFLTQNLFNDLLIHLELSARAFYDELTSLMKARQDIPLAFIGLSSLILLLNFVIIFPTYATVKRTRQEVLDLFLTIPDSTLKGLYAKSEKFAFEIQEREDTDGEDVVSENFSEILDEGAGSEAGGSPTVFGRKKRKRYRNIKSRKLLTGFVILTISCVVQIYFVGNYFLSQTFLDRFHRLMPEFRMTNRLEWSLIFLDNLRRLQVIGPDSPVYVTMKPATFAIPYLWGLYDDVYALDQVHNTNTQDQNELYLEIHRTMHHQSMCHGILKGKVTERDCLTIASGAFDQGLGVALHSYLDKVSQFLQLYKDASASASQDILTYLLNTPLSYELTQMQTSYLDVGVEALIQGFHDGLNGDYETLNTIKLLFYIGFNIFAVCVYISIWLPLVLQITKRIWRTQSMLSMIPLKIVAESHEIRSYLKDFINMRSTDQ
eukprot:TRINITY_DN4579_c0_g3_i4.p1 TRINITY_DN4579_c0_g3~~TRINITY_DN4579_c0_g3_i4.p1  ORF type:complete len:455 (-),score=121.20 TRINITY_DN4579_c0_g3_i4:1093-2457(-)